MTTHFLFVGGPFGFQRKLFFRDRRPALNVVGHAPHAVLNKAAFETKLFVAEVARLPQIASGCIGSLATSATVAALNQHDFQIPFVVRAAL
jgi:hypothetical protein